MGRRNVLCFTKLQRSFQFILSFVPMKFRLRFLRDLVIEEFDNICKVWLQNVFLVFVFSHKQKLNINVETNEYSIHQKNHSKSQRRIFWLMNHRWSFILENFDQKGSAISYRFCHWVRFVEQCANGAMGARKALRRCQKFDNWCTFLQRTHRLLEHAHVKRSSVLGGLNEITTFELFTQTTFYGTE